jgi:hypothetical protein
MALPAMVFSAAFWIRMLPDETLLVLPIIEGSPDSRGEMAKKIEPLNR